MANLKKLLAGAMALCMAGAMFASCGNTEEGGSDSKSNTTNNAGTNENKGGEEGGNGGEEGGNR